MATSPATWRREGAGTVTASARGRVPVRRKYFALDDIHAALAKTVRYYLPIKILIKSTKWLVIGEGLSQVEAANNDQSDLSPLNHVPGSIFLISLSPLSLSLL